MKKCYIAGKITGTNDFKERFKDAEWEVTLMGMIAVNPTTLPHNHDKEWQSYMKECIAELVKCDAVYMLQGWLNSDGARLERSIADSLRMEVYLEGSIL